MFRSACEAKCSADGTCAFHAFGRDYTDGYYQNLFVDFTVVAKSAATGLNVTNKATSA